MSPSWMATYQLQLGTQTPDNTIDAGHPQICTAHPENVFHILTFFLLYQDWTWLDTQLLQTVFETGNYFELKYSSKF